MNLQRFGAALTIVALLSAGITFTTQGRALAATVLAIVTCASTLPCTGGTNTSSGAGVQGISSLGKGVIAQTKFNSTTATNAQFGLLGQDLSTSGTFDEGVRGTSVRGLGVHGMSTSRSGVRGDATSAQGVFGSSSSNAGTQGVSVTGPGVLGQSTSTTGSGNGVTGTALGHGNGVAGTAAQGGIGVSGTSTSGYGLYGSGVYGSIGAGSSSGVGAYGTGAYGTYGVGTSYGAVGSSSAGRGVYGVTSNGQAVFASSTSGRAIEGHTGSGLGLYVTNGSGNGADIAGSYAGVIARATSFPIVATDPTGNNLFYVDGNGAVFAHNGFHTFAPINGGGSATAFSSRTTTPTIEDTGTARLVNGVAAVSLDPTFARTIDPHALYHVMLTPDGDTRGLFIARKSATGFVVRETMGGRGTLDFDYHIYATAVGSAGQRMTIAGPNVPALKAANLRPALRAAPQLKP